MTLHVQARVDILRYFSEKFETFGCLAWVKSVHVYASPSKNYNVKTRKLSRKWVSNPYPFNASVSMKATNV